MKITVESTSKVVALNGVECRIWEGETSRGVKVHAFIPRVGVKDDQDLSEFERDLKETRCPSAEVEAIPLRMIL